MKFCSASCGSWPEDVFQILPDDTRKALAQFQLGPKQHPLPAKAANCKMPISGSSAGLILSFLDCLSCLLGVAVLLNVLKIPNRIPRRMHNQEQFGTIPLGPWQMPTAPAGFLLYSAAGWG